MWGVASRLTQGLRVASQGVVRAQSAAVVAQPRTFHSSPLPRDGDLHEVLTANKKWVAEQNERDPEFFKRLGAGQAPKYLYIGCSDSRVPPNNLLGLGPGELFVHRNVANLVVSTDLNFLSVLEYAVTALKVQDIIVCGHYDCGGVRAAVGGKHNGNIENWLNNIRDIARYHWDELKTIEDIEARHRRLVEINVEEQAINIFRNNIVQNSRKEGGGPNVHGLVFDPAVGILHKLDVDFKKLIKPHSEICGETLA